MFRLRNQIRGDEFCPARIAEDDHLCRTRKEINRAIEREQLFGQRHVAIPGSDDFVHARNQPGTKGQSGHCLRSSNSKNFTYSEQVRCCQHFSLWLGRNHTNVLHACDLGGDHGHQERRNQRMPSSGDVTADGFEGAHNLAAGNAVPIFSPLAGLLVLAKSSNVGRRLS